MKKELEEISKIIEEREETHGTTYSFEKVAKIINVLFDEGTDLRNWDVCVIQIVLKLVRFVEGDEFTLDHKLDHDCMLPVFAHFDGRSA